MGKPLYNLPGDDLAKLYAPTLHTGSVDPNYPLENLSNDNPALPAKFTTTSVRLVWDLGSPQLVELPIFLHWNVDAGATATWEINTSDTWPGGVVTPIVTNPANGAGYRPYSWLDRSAGLGRQFVSLAISGNAAPIVIGGIWLGTVKRTLPNGIRLGLTLPSGQESVVLRTNMNVRHAFQRARIGGLENGDITTNVSGLADLQTFGDACGWRARPVPLILDPDVNEAWFVNWAQDRLEPEPISVFNRRSKVAFEHVSPGEAWS